MALSSSVFEGEKGAERLVRMMHSRLHYEGEMGAERRVPEVS
jgi:hypothetical protein